MKHIHNWTWNAVAALVVILAMPGAIVMASAGAIGGLPKMFQAIRSKIGGEQQ